PRGALLDEPVATRSSVAGAAALRRRARHLRAEIASQAQSYRHERCTVAARRRYEALGHRTRLPRRHAASRYQALFCVNRRGCGRGSRLARRASVNESEPAQWRYYYAVKSVTAFSGGQGTQGCYRDAANAK